MMDFSAIAQAVTALKSLTDIAVSALKARDDANSAANVQEVLAEQEKGLKAVADSRVAIFALQDENAVLRQENRELKNQVANLTERKRDFERYALAELSPGVTIFAIRPEHQGTEPMHYLCSRCIDRNEKSILQIDKTKLAVAMTCPNCNTRFPTGEVQQIHGGFFSR